MNHQLKPDIPAVLREIEEAALRERLALADVTRYQRPELTMQGADRHIPAAVRGFLHNRWTYVTEKSRIQDHNFDEQREETEDARRRENNPAQAVKREPYKPNYKSLPKKPVTELKNTTGGGKTRNFINAACEVPQAPTGEKDETRDLRISLFVPSHKLAAQVVADFEAQQYRGVVRHMRGIAQPSPDDPEQCMCLNLPWAEIILDAGLPLSDACGSCEHGPGGKEPTCPWRAQWEQPATVRVMPHQYLTQSAPFTDVPDVVVIDEDASGTFLRGTEKSERCALSVEELAAPLILPGLPTEEEKVAMNKDVEESEQYKGPTMEVLKTWNDGNCNAASRIERVRGAFWPMKKGVGVAHPRTGTMIKFGYWLLRAAKKQGGPYELAATIERYRVGEITRKIQFWKVVGKANTADMRAWEAGNRNAKPWHLARTSWRDGHGRREMVEMRWREYVNPRFDVPTLVMDATSEPLVMEAMLQPKETRREGVALESINLSVKAENARVVQITDKNMTKTALLREGKRKTGSADNTGKNLRSRVMTHTQVLQRIHAQQGDNPTVVLITQKEVEETLLEQNPPEAWNGIDIAHFNAIEGLNNWEKTPVLVNLGQPRPTVEAVELTAGVLFDEPVEEIPPVKRTKNSRTASKFFPQRVTAINLADGSEKLVENAYHPDERCDAVLRNILQSAVTQSIGRVRGIRREEQNPATIYALTNTVVPELIVDEVGTLDEILFDKLDLLLAEIGVVPLGARVLARLFPGRWATRKTARTALGDDPAEVIIRQNPGAKTPIQSNIGGGFSSKKANSSWALLPIRNLIGKRAQLEFENGPFSGIGKRAQLDLEPGSVPDIGKTTQLELEPGSDPDIGKRAQPPVKNGSAPDIGISTQLEFENAPLRRAVSGEPLLAIAQVAGPRERPFASLIDSDIFDGLPGSDFQLCAEQRLGVKLSHFKLYRFVEPGDQPVEVTGAAPKKLVADLHQRGLGIVEVVPADKPASYGLKDMAIWLRHRRQKHALGKMYPSKTLVGGGGLLCFVTTPRRLRRTPESPKNTGSKVRGAPDR